MIEQKPFFLVSHGQILKLILKAEKDNRIGKVVEAIGPENVMLLLESLPGHVVTFPTLATLKRLNKTAYIIQELEGLVGKEKKTAVARVAQLVKMGKPAVLRTYRAKKFRE